MSKHFKKVILSIWKSRNIYFWKTLMNTKVPEPEWSNEKIQVERWLFLQLLLHFLLVICDPKNDSQENQSLGFRSISLNMKKFVPLFCIDM